MSIAAALSLFGQIANVHTRMRDGSGLGLPLVKSMAALHGAGFLIESEPGAGTTVTIMFPASRVRRRIPSSVDRLSPRLEEAAAD